MANMLSKVPIFTSLTIASSHLSLAERNSSGIARGPHRFTAAARSAGEAEVDAVVGCDGSLTRCCATALKLRRWRSRASASGNRSSMLLPETQRRGHFPGPVDDDEQKNQVERLKSGGRDLHQHLQARGEQ